MSANSCGHCGHDKSAHLNVMRGCDRHDCHCLKWREKVPDCEWAIRCQSPDATVHFGVFPTQERAQRSADVYAQRDLKGNTWKVVPLTAKARKAMEMEMEKEMEMEMERSAT